MNCCTKNGMAGARRTGLLLCALLAGSGAYADEWTLSAQDLARLDRREVLLSQPSGRDRAAASFRAAIEIKARAEQVFRTMTDCAQALKFVPHLIHCVVLESAPDGSWQTIEHVVNYGWYRPRASYVFRAVYEPFDRISFSSVRGDFRENEGVWELLPRADGAVTLVTYRAQVAARFYVPRWMILASLKRDLPALMQGLRALCETP
jgi:ribosome-associated toxin RatA of RatAB toxin-antitoxin module